MSSAQSRRSRAKQVQEVSTHSHGTCLDSIRFPSWTGAQRTSRAKGSPVNTTHRSSRSAACRKSRPANSCRRPLSGQTRPLSSQTRPVSCQTGPETGQSRNRTPDPSLRAHSSLGFAWGEEKFRHDCTPPLGFDIAQYLRQCGSGTEIRIGQNGELSTDHYLQSYLSDCRMRQLQKEEEKGGREVNVCLEGETSEGGSVSANGCFARVPGPEITKVSVPLCWEDLLRDTEVSSVVHHAWLHGVTSV